MLLCGIGHVRGSSWPCPSGSSLGAGMKTVLMTHSPPVTRYRPMISWMAQEAHGTSSTLAAFESHPTIFAIQRTRMIEETNVLPPWITKYTPSSRSQNCARVTRIVLSHPSLALESAASGDCGEVGSLMVWLAPCAWNPRPIAGHSNAGGQAFATRADIRRDFVLPDSAGAVVAGSFGQRRRSLAHAGRYRLEFGDRYHLQPLPAQGVSCRERPPFLEGNRRWGRARAICHRVWSAQEQPITIAAICVGCLRSGDCA